MTHAWRTTLLAGALLTAALGCGKKQAALPEPLPPIVDVSRPVMRQVTEYEYFTGRTDAAEMVEIRSRVTGYLEKAPVSKNEAKNGEVKEGDDVKAGTPLFVIDDSTFQAEVDRAEANIKQYQALIERLDKDLSRARSMSLSRSVSREETDKINGDRNQAEANIKGAKAALRLANVNLGYTKVAAPISGRLSRRHVDPGNLVKADDTILTTIVKLDPIHAYFDIDERTVIRFREMLKAKQIESARKTPVKVTLGLADEREAYEREGVIDFIDNRLDAGTGTLRIRVETQNDDQFLSPGMFIRLRLPVGKPREAMLVPESAMASKQGQKVVYVVRREAKKDVKGEPVVDDDDKPVAVDNVYEIPVVAGQLDTELDKEGKVVRSWRVIKSAGANGQGLKLTDDVVVSGLQRVRPGRPVRLGRDAKQ